MVEAPSGSPLPFGDWNLQSRTNWDRYAPHRRRQMRLLLSGRPGGTLAVLGAGNGNDLDLPVLLAHYDRTTLFDLDDAALRFAAAGQGVLDSPGLHLRGGVDVTGVARRVADFAAAARALHDDDEADALIRDAAVPTAEIDAMKYDLVASTTLLTQIMTLAHRAFPGGGPRLVAFARALRQGHLRRLLSLAAPGGQVIVVSDFVSSDSAPEIAAATEGETSQLAERLLAAGNFLTGSHPLQLLQTLTETPDLAAQIAEQRLVGPWKWDFGARQYLVFAAVLRKK